MSDPVVLLSTGDVVGPAGGVTDNSMVLFSGTSGKLIKGNNAQVTSAGLALLDDVDAAAQRTTLQLKSAATIDVVTGIFDTGDAGARALTNQAWGLGSLGVSAPSTDYNQITRSGFYRINGLGTNGPAGLYDGILHVVGGVDIVAQTAYSHADGRSWTRTRTPTTWTRWALVSTDTAPQNTNLVSLGSNYTIPYICAAQKNANLITVSGHVQCNSVYADGQGIGWLPNGWTPSVIAHCQGTATFNNATATVISLTVGTNGLVSAGRLLPSMAIAYPIGITFSVTMMGT